DAALRVRTIWMAERRDEQPIGILRVDRDLGDLLRVTQPQVCPRLPGVAGSVNAVTDGEVWTRQPFTATNVQNIGIRRRHGDPADRPGRLIVEDRLPRAAGVGRLPDAAVNHPDVKGVRLARVPGSSFRPTRAERTDVAPLQIGEQHRIHLRRLLGGHRDGDRCDQCRRGKDECRQTADWHPPIVVPQTVYFAASLRTVVTFRIVPMVPAILPKGTAAGDWPKLPRVFQYNSRLCAAKSSSFVRRAFSFSVVALSAVVLRKQTCSLQSLGTSSKGS